MIEIQGIVPGRNYCIEGWKNFCHKNHHLSANINKCSCGKEDILFVCNRCGQTICKSCMRGLDYEHGAMCRTCWDKEKEIEAEIGNRSF